ncbi:TonB-dependent receptor [Sediminibacterium ginsengisoli]|uniref:Iron complex outermembrane recepter protein n=1 Tax=Sediminibacterium ginsengisoli TaxID=413434 RepID=A0A1T4KTT7_9BACT|nr:TonB-dependent receptor [Sediminibacterium ginsengisoli]SJZ45780.1 iron complex outermembrane recepter protein [Sediminibacterium ginsengisoli]
MKRILYLLLFLSCSFSSLFANEVPTGTVKGRITTRDNQPGAFVSVVVIGTGRSTVSDEEGYFTISKVSSGNRKLEVTLVGYETLHQNVQVEDNKTVTVNLRISISNSELQEVTVTNSKSKFVYKSSDYVARMPLRNLENPQVYNVVGRAIMQDQVIIERTDLYRNIPGAVPNFSAGGSMGLSMRGFSTTIGMRNGMATSAIVPLNPAILERVESIKGPSGTLFGSNRNVTFGGVYNYVTKRPYDQFGGEISFAGGSYEFSRITADINTPLNKEKTMLLRVNAAGQSEGSFQDQGFNKNYTFAPTFSYQVNDRLKFTLDMEATRGNYTVVSFSLGNLNNITARNFKDLPLDYKKSYINNSTDVNNGINNLQAQIEYKISDQWKSQTNYLYSVGFYKNFYWTALNMLNDSMYARVVRNQTPETFGNIEVQQNFIGDFKIGGLRNRMVIGLDYNYNYNELYRATVNFDTINIRSASIRIMSRTALENVTASRFTSSNTVSKNASIYASDVVNLTDELMAMLSLRVDHFSTRGTYSPLTGLYTGGYEQTSVSPKFGLVYQVIKNKLSLFGNYMNGFVNLAPATQPDGSVLVLKPQYGNQWEGGVKFDLFNTQLNGSVSFYNIDVTNSTRTEVIGGLNFTIQDGTQRSRGIEAEVIASPFKGLSIVAGYGYNENTYINAAASLKGKNVIFSPTNIANLWTSYTIPEGSWKGLGLGAGVNYTGASWFDAANLFKVPAYTLLSATAFYDAPKFRVALKGNNLSDQRYWNNNGSPQKPVNFIASVSLKF